MVSIIIRTKNEDRWITACLVSVFKQDYKDFEVIIVDNESTDKTLEKVSQFKVRKVIKCKNYRPGLALNMGIREAKGEFIACLSGHCIPVNEKWLSSLLGNFSSGEIAAAYGRQEPLAFTPDSDKRGVKRSAETISASMSNSNQ